MQGKPHSASGEEEGGPEELWTQPRLMSVVLPFCEVTENTEPWLLVETQVGSCEPRVPTSSLTERYTVFSYVLFSYDFGVVVIKCIIQFRKMVMMTL